MYLALISDSFICSWTAKILFLAYCSNCCNEHEHPKFDPPLSSLVSLTWQLSNLSIFMSLLLSGIKDGMICQPSPMPNPSIGILIPSPHPPLPSSISLPASLSLLSSLSPPLSFSPILFFLLSSLSFPPFSFLPLSSPPLPCLPLPLPSLLPSSPLSNHLGLPWDFLSLPLLSHICSTQLSSDWLPPHPLLPLLLHPFLFQLFHGDLRDDTSLSLHAEAQGSVPSTF